MLPFVLLSAFLWGTCVALFIEYTEVGRLMALRLTWFIAALGTGGDLLLLLFLMDSVGRVYWWQLVAVLFVSSIPVAARGIFELVAYFKGLMDDAKDQAGE